MNEATQVTEVTTAQAPETASGPIIRLRALTKTYDTGAVQVHALRGIDLEVPTGEMLAIMGPSGCGKTTLLNIIAGLDRNFEGRIDLPGQNGQSAKPVLGYMFQTPRLLPWRTVAQNLELVLGHDPNRKATVRRWLETVDLAKETARGIPALQGTSVPAVFCDAVRVQLGECAMLFISGKIGVTADGALAGRTMREQTRQVLENIKAVLEREGGTMDDIVRVRVYATQVDAASLRDIHEVRSRFWTAGKYPASTPRMPPASRPRNAETRPTVSDERLA